MVDPEIFPKRDADNLRSLAEWYQKHMPAADHIIKDLHRIADAIEDKGSLLNMPEWKVF